MQQSTTRLQGRTALVAGADWIGCGVARALHDAGATVALLGDEFAVTDDASWMVRYDSKDAHSLAHAVAAALNRLQHLDILVTNLLPDARVAPLAEISLSSMTESLEGVMRTLQTLQTAFPELRRGSCGRIINVGHRYGEGINGSIGPYNSAVWALWGLTRTAAVEWGQYGITSNLLVPFADTPELSAARALRPALMETLLQQLPLRRAGDPTADVGAAAVFLASDEAAFINGETLYADGGQHIAGAVYNPARFRTE